MAELVSEQKGHTGTFQPSCSCWYAYLAGPFGILVGQHFQQPSSDECQLFLKLLFHFVGFCDFGAETSDRTADPGSPLHHELVASEHIVERSLARCARLLICNQKANSTICVIPADLTDIDLPARTYRKKLIIRLRIEELLKDFAKTSEQSTI